MFILGMFWKRTTGAAAIAGVLTGFILSVVFDNYAPAWFGNETWIYTAYPNGTGAYEIPFLLCMALSFFFTVSVMVSMSLAGPKINPKAFALDKGVFRLTTTNKINDYRCVINPYGPVCEVLVVGGCSLFVLVLERLTNNE